MNVLIDTDVFSFIIKNDTRKHLYEKHLAGNQLVISFMTIAELERWALERNWGKTTREKVEAHLRDYIVVYPDRRVMCELWASVIVDTKRKGKMIQHADVWIAATALLYNIPLITHNRKDFEAVEHLAIISES